DNPERVKHRTFKAPMFKQPGNSQNQVTAAENLCRDWEPGRKSCRGLQHSKTFGSPNRARESLVPPLRESAVVLYAFCAPGASLANQSVSSSSVLPERNILTANTPTNTPRPKMTPKDW